MTLVFVLKLGLKIYHINVKTSKIDGSILQTFKMVLASFQIEDKFGQARFFQELFLLANINVEMILGIFFLTFSNAKILFAEQKLIQRFYSIAEALLITKQVKIINKKEFTKIALDTELETFVMYIAALEFLLLGMTIHPFKAAQVDSKSAQIAALNYKKAPIKVLFKYLNILDVFLAEKTLILLEKTKLNNHAIKLEKDKQLPYRLIYNLRLIKLKTLKIYIKTCLKIRFI